MKNNMYATTEERENRLAANKALIFAGIFFVFFIMNLLGLFYVPQKLFMIVSVIVFGAVIGIQFLGKHPKMADKVYSKFIIVFLVFVMTLSIMTVLNFHAILLLCFPMLIALNYHSEKVSIITFILSVICGALWPVLGALLNTWDVSYFVFILDVISPHLVEGTPLKDYQILKVVGLKDIWLFISIPQVGFALLFGSIILISNYISRKSYDEQIRELRDSRDKILLGMSDIVENRDFNTGGHIRRTSEVVRLLVEELPSNITSPGMTHSEYSEYVIKTAPMHDLGKIAIPDAILGKPGKLTNEEFEYIKIHPQKSYDIINSMLLGLKDERLMKVAENIALYHHEKFDGNGYPKGLKGEEIPLEARIMAIADVYDALVSYRCYKKPFSSEQAYNIIKESMGTHFDPMLWDCFDKAFTKIKDFYTIA